MHKISLRVLLLPLFVVSSLMLGCEALKQIPPTYPDGVAPDVAPDAPTTQPANGSGPVSRDEFKELLGRVNTIAITTAASTPPGNPVHTGALGVAAVSGLLLSANELLKKLLGKKSAPDNP